MLPLIPVMIGVGAMLLLAISGKKKEPGAEPSPAPTGPYYPPPPVPGMPPPTVVVEPPEPEPEPEPAAPPAAPTPGAWVPPPYGEISPPGLAVPIPVKDLPEEPPSTVEPAEPEPEPVAPPPSLSIPLPGGGTLPLPIAPPAIPPPPPPSPGKPAPLPAEELKSDPDGTIHLARLMIAAESSPGWKAVSDTVKIWQTKKRLTPDGKFGLGGALVMADEVGILPLIRYFAKGTPTKTSGVDKARAAYMAKADALEREGKKEHADALRMSASYEEGQGWPPNPPPVPEAARVAQLAALDSMLGGG